MPHGSRITVVVSGSDDNPRWSVATMVTVMVVPTAPLALESNGPNWP